MDAGNPSESPDICGMCPVHNPPPAGIVSSPMPVNGPVCDWLDSQANVLGLWLDRLIAQGDPGDLISMVHRQQAWLQMLRARMGRG
jgi:hypothetical protein